VTEAAVTAPAGLRLTPATVLEALDAVKDPEIPVVSVVELGIVQSVTVDGDDVTVAITPTFSGCPALHVMREEIEACVLALGARQVTVDIVLDPPWTSDRIAPAARERMKAIGLAPPPPAARRAFAIDLELLPRADAPSEAPPACPFCNAMETELENAFGPTICRALYYCHACQQPFEQFKAL
jgi:ring-1,2-phenylacetyl-CoA epoxidase subunit PaaD